MALLFWLDITGNLKLRGFVANPYNHCVMNKTINVLQCTIIWHVDYLKISHVNPDVVTAIIFLLLGVYGRTVPLTETRGTNHDYLGVQIDFSMKGTDNFLMEE